MSKPGTNTAYLEKVTGDGIALVVLDHYPLNSLSGEVMNALTQCVVDIEKAGDAVKGVVVRGAGRAFCAGADISAFGNMKQTVDLGRPKSGFIGFEELSVPVVAAIHGFALGGGLEVSLDCHYRVIDSKASVGLPEVNIGLLPGGQGTVRLPRIVGCDNAIQIMTTGRHVRATKALEAGVVDAIAPAGTDLLTAAMDFCRSKMGSPPRRISKLPNPTPVDFVKWKKQLAKKRRGEPAPQRIIECVEAASSMPFAEADKVEKKLFLKLMMSPESAALRYAFFSERAANKVEAATGGAKPVPIKTVGIIGAGLMGGGIAMCCANVGISVKLLDMNSKGLERGLKLIQSNYNRSVKSGSRSKEQVQRSMNLIQGTLTYDDLKDCDLVIEAVFEDMDIKKKVFTKLDQVCKPSAILCSNTSFLDIDQIASFTSRPDKVMGAHFFSPANVMKLLENIKGSKTSATTIATLMNWGKKIGKVAILVGNCDGFVGNRMVAFYSAAARQMVLQGVPPMQIDKAAMNFGMRMGPLAMGDLVGIDLGIQAVKKKGQYKPLENITHALIEAGRLGQKTKSGYYDYDDNRRPSPSPAVDKIVQDLSARKGIAKLNLTDEEIIQRLFFPLINEGFKVVEEGIVQRPSDIDICYLYGYGFPSYRGGPMHYADYVGLDEVLKGLEKMGIQPAKLLVDCVKADVSLARYFKKAQKAKRIKSKL